MRRLIPRTSPARTDVAQRIRCAVRLAERACKTHWMFALWAVLASERAAAWAKAGLGQLGDGRVG